MSPPWVTVRREQCNLTVRCCLYSKFYTLHLKKPAIYIQNNISDIIFPFPYFNVILPLTCGFSASESCLPVNRKIKKHCPVK